MILTAWLYIVAGVPCYTDALERVPSAYRAEAQQVEIGPLEDYVKFTPADQISQRPLLKTHPQL